MTILRASVFALSAMFALGACQRRAYNSEVQDAPASASASGDATSVAASKVTVKLSSPKAVLNLLQENSPTSRETAAANIEREFADVMKNADAGTATMRVALDSTIKALREGANTLCADAEKISLYRGVDTSQQTQGGDPILVSNDLLSGATSLRQVADVITGGKTADFEAHAKQLMEKSSLGAFVWATLKPQVAAATGQRFLQIRACPQRVLALVNDPNLEGRFAIFGAILPEEIVQVFPASEADAAIPSPLLQCFSTLPKTGNFEFVKTANRVLMSSYRDRVVKNVLAQMQGLKYESWLALDLQTTGLCTCAGIVKRANEVAFAVTKIATPMWQESDFCPVEE